jgi:hypothetical protein
MKIGRSNSRLTIGARTLERLQEEYRVLQHIPDHLPSLPAFPETQLARAKEKLDSFEAHGIRNHEQPWLQTCSVNPEGNYVETRIDRTER